MKKVFISYRREDTQAIAGRLYDALEARLGTDTVFFDIDSIPLGTDFREHVRTALDHCAVLLVVIGARWLDGGREGRRRLDDPDDPVRVELEAALERRIPIVPVLIDQTVMPSADVLPEPLAGLAYRNAVRVDSGIDFRNHLARLVAGITPLVEAAGKRAAREPAPVPAPKDAPPISTTDERVDTPATAATPAWRRPWTLGALGAALLCTVYVSLSFRLAGSMDQVEARLRALAIPPPGASAPPPPSPDPRIVPREEKAGS